MRTIRFATIGLCAALLLTLPVQSLAAKGKIFKKQWRITVTIPDSPLGNVFGTRTFTIKARKNNVSPSPLPLQQLTATTEDGSAQVEGVWRQDGSDTSFTFELPCAEGTTCGTLVIRGRFTTTKAMSGEAYVMWDTRDALNITGFETVNGTVTGTRF